MLKEVLESLDEYQGQWRIVAAGAGVKYTYIRMLGSGRIKNPGVKQIESLYAWFAQQKVERQVAVSE